MIRDVECMLNFLQKMAAAEMDPPEWLAAYLNSRTPEQPVEDEDALMRAWLIQSHWTLLAKRAALAEQEHVNKKKCQAHSKWANRVKKQSTILYKTLNGGASMQLVDAGDDSRDVD